MPLTKLRHVRYRFAVSARPRPQNSTSFFCKSMSKAAQYRSGSKRTTRPRQLSWSSWTSWRITLSVFWPCVRRSASRMMCSVSVSAPRSSIFTSSPVALGREPLGSARRARLGGGAPDCWSTSLAQASKSSDEIGKHRHKNQEGGRPSSRCGAHSASLALMANSTFLWNWPTNGCFKPHAGGRWNLIISSFTRSSIFVGKNACSWRTLNRDLIRFSRELMTSIFSDIPTMDMRMPTSCAMSKRLYSSVCRPRAQNSSKRSSTITTALECLKLSRSMLRIHSMPCSKDAFLCGKATSCLTTCVARWRMHSTSDEYWPPSARRTTSDCSASQSCLTHHSMTWVFPEPASPRRSTELFSEPSTWLRLAFIIVKTSSQSDMSVCSVISLRSERFELMSSSAMATCSRLHWYQSRVGAFGVAAVRACAPLPAIPTQGSGESHGASAEGGCALMLVT
mmetsp:Transcript_89995/g.255047  ORF Transcript_89995/g.255047 Transcript_89995/m.255047 type:complete len:451 (-) Transcript_89995:3-1355(-)